MRPTAHARKPRLVLVPGLGTDGTVYERFLRELRGAYDIRTADVPVRFPPGGLSWSFFFASIDRALEGGSGYLVAHSMGGAIALKYAASHPDRVKAVVAVAPVVFPRRPGRPAIEGLDRFRSYRLLRGAGMALASGNVQGLLAAHRARRRVRQAGQLPRLYEWVWGIDLSRDLPRLRNATVLWPEHEEVIDPRTETRIRDEFPNVTLQRIPGSHNDLALSPGGLIRPVEEALDG